MKQQKHRQILSSIFAVLLFSLYLSADLINSLHSTVLHQKITKEVCSIEQEEDACHRAIYHNDAEKGCNHTSHIIPQIVDCELCSIVLHRHTLPKNEAALLLIIENRAITKVVELSAATKSYHYTQPLRGPPSFS